jgi:hypothetical protein
MAKPDIQASFITASGTLFRLKGKLGLEDKGPITGLDLAGLNFTSDSVAGANGVGLGEFYHTNGDLKIRRT